MADEEISDLLEVARRLRKSGRNYKQIISLIERYQGICSAKIDLDVARTCCRILIREFVEMVEGYVDQDQEHAAVGGALFCQAVIFYARATGTASKGRAGSGIKDRIPDEFDASHRRFMALRNEALAHYGPDGGDGWAKETIILKRRVDSFEITSLWSRFNYQGDTSNELAELIKATLVIAGTIEQERLTELQAAILPLLERDPFFQDVVASCPVDLREFFGEGAEAPEEGERKFGIVPSAWRDQSDREDGAA